MSLLGPPPSDNDLLRAWRRLDELLSQISSIHGTNFGRQSVSSDKFSFTKDNFPTDPTGKIVTTDKGAMIKEMVPIASASLNWVGGVADFLPPRWGFNVDSCNDLNHQYVLHLQLKSDSCVVLSNCDYRAGFISPPVGSWYVSETQIMQLAPFGGVEGSSWFIAWGIV